MRGPLGNPVQALVLQRGLFLLHTQDFISTRMTGNDLLKIADARLNPSLTNPNYLVLRARRRIFAPYLQGLKDDLMVLDVGGRYQPYRPLLRGKVSKYFALDVDRTEFVSAVGNGQHLPFRDEAFDLVIATGVFEYLSVCNRDVWPDGSAA